MGGNGGNPVSPPRKVITNGIKSSAKGADTGSTKYPAASISNQGHVMNGDRMLDGGQQSVLHLWHENKSIT